MKTLGRTWLAMLAVVAIVGAGTRLDAQVKGTPVQKTHVVDSARPPETGGEAKDEDTTRMMSVREILETGGWVMYVLAGMSVITVAFIVYFFIVLNVGQVAPRSQHRDVVEKIRMDKIDEARRACEYKTTPLSAVVLIALDYLHNVPRDDASLLKDLMEGEGTRHAESILGQIQFLLDIAVISPMIGLFGTVLGMLKAFNSVALELAKAKPMELASGVSQALITTAFGLIVGIVAMMFYAVFRRKASKVVSALEIASTDVLTALSSRITNEVSS